MKENVGTVDQVARAITGPVLLILGYKKLGGNRGNLPGLITMIAATTLIESAITRVCPLNSAFGIDTRNKKTVIKDLTSSARSLISR